MMFWSLEMIVTLIFRGICSLSQWGRICGGKSCHHQAGGSNSVFHLSVLIIFGYSVSLRDLQVPPSPSFNALTPAESMSSSNTDEEARIASPTLDVLEDASDSLEGSDSGLNPWKGKTRVASRFATEEHRGRTSKRLKKKTPYVRLIEDSPSTGSDTEEVSDVDAFMGSETVQAQKVSHVLLWYTRLLIFL